MALPPTGLSIFGNARGGAPGEFAEATWRRASVLDAVAAAAAER